MKPLHYLVAIMLAFELATIISPDLFGAPDNVRLIIAIAMLGVIIASAILLIKEFTE